MSWGAPPLQQKQHNYYKQFAQPEKKHPNNSVKMSLIMVGAVLLIFCTYAVYVITTAGKTNTAQQTTPSPTQQPPVGPSSILVPAPLNTQSPTVNPLPSQLPQPDQSSNLVFFGLMDWILPGNIPAGYSFGNIAPTGPTISPEYFFPIYVQRFYVDRGVGRAGEILLAISDPHITQEGVQWDSGVISDPDYSNVMWRIKLLRIAETSELNNYQITAALSVDHGKTWRTMKRPSDGEINVKNPNPTITINQPSVVMKPKVKLSTITESFMFDGRVLEVNVQNKYITVKTRNDESIKVNLSQETEIEKILGPDFAYIPLDKDDIAVPAKKLSVAIQDIKPGDLVFIHSKKNITGKVEIGDIDLVSISP